MIPSKLQSFKTQLG